ncbi:hypothetical protein G7K_0911-t1 [Saitoella complicata NRRL Y-17804]|uniref:Uncharacterized protein n=1 Tax=Saitoella complicata (strain BCRC 22490 / CBS 7301 / JCM 7358 / NBRC 10748 / NRRL Y-17804) TaxID=698492 RepID=A0A0E9N9X1_SAICN|nr:hypothetical protein G7K_0911-t1 [Saitoella complicata NRRL Y-17804]
MRISLWELSSEVLDTIFNLRGIQTHTHQVSSQPFLDDLIVTRVVSLVVTNVAFSELVFPMDLPSDASQGWAGWYAWPWYVDQGREYGLGGVRRNVNYMQQDCWAIAVVEPGFTVTIERPPISDSVFKDFQEAFQRADIPASTPDSRPSSAGHPSPQPHERLKPSYGTSSRRSGRIPGVCAGAFACLHQLRHPCCPAGRD